jgi:NADH-quinone oxidoreductase subunit L
MTSFYSWRLYFLTFEGPERWREAHGHAHDPAVATHAAHAADGPPGHHEGVAHDDKGHDIEPASHADHEHHGPHPDHTPHESPLTMLVPLALLAIGSVAAGFAFKEYFLGHHYEAFWKGSLVMAEGNNIVEEMHHVPAWVVWSPAVMMLLGLALSYWFYIVDRTKPAALAAQQPLLYRFLLNKWYFDELYDRIFVRPAMWLGRFFWKKGDGWFIDGLGPDGISARVIDVTRGVVRLQTGYVYHYAFAMLIGVAALVTWYLAAGGGAH